MFCISLNIHFLQSLLKFKNFIINKPKNSLFIFLVLIVVFITVTSVNAVQELPSYAHNLNNPDEVFL